MIREAADDEVDKVCGLFAGMSPWTVLGIRAEELAHGFRLDPLRKMYVWSSDIGGEIGGAVIVRERAAAEQLFFRGFGEILALRHNVVCPCRWDNLPDAGYISSLAVFHDQTGRGIGSALLNAAHEIFRAAGHPYSYLMVSAFNPRAKLFYERNNYRCIGHLDNCLRPGNREYLMEKVL